MACIIIVLIQFIQAQKAEFFTDMDTRTQILKASSPLECKELARNISGFNYESWKEVAKSHCKPGIEAKFISNPYLINMLQSTGNKTFVEACYDKLWGTGIPLHDKDCRKKDLWSNTGIQGEILMEIRQSLKSQFTASHMDTLPPCQPNGNPDTGSQELTN